MHTSRSMRLLRRCSAGEDCCGCGSRYSTCSAVAAAPAIISSKGSAKLVIISVANGYFCGFTVTTLALCFRAAGGHSSLGEWPGCFRVEKPRGWSRACRVYKFYTLIDFWPSSMGCANSPPQTFLWFTLDRVKITTLWPFFALPLLYWLFWIVLEEFCFLSENQDPGEM